jgi:hypothetical protein
LWALASAALMAIGGFGPWVTFLGFSASGTEGDGWIVIVAARMAAGFVFWHDNVPGLWRWAPPRSPGWLPSVWQPMTGRALRVSQPTHTRSFGEFFEVAVSPGWGLIISVLASASLVTALLVHYVKFDGGRFGRLTPAPAGPPETPRAA